MSLYKYLGIDIHHKINWNYSIDKRINGGWKYYYGLENNCKLANLWLCDTNKLMFETLEVGRGKNTKLNSIKLQIDIAKCLQNDYNRLLFIENFGRIPKIQRVHKVTGVSVIKSVEEFSRKRWRFPVVGRVEINSSNTPP